MAGRSAAAVATLVLGWAVSLAATAGASGGPSDEFTGVHPAKAAAQPVTVMAYNVLFDASSQEIEASVDAIEATQPDIVCLRELTPAFEARFVRRLGATYRHRSFHARRGTWGVGIASRWRLSAAKHFPERPHRIPALEARIATPAGELLAVCVHLFPPVGKHHPDDGVFETMDKNAALRVDQARALVERLAPERGAVVVMGDMNEGPDNGALAVLATSGGLPRACDTAEVEDCGATWPGPHFVWPAVLEIDHILGRKVTFEAAWVVAGGGSDHKAVAARLRQ